MCRLASFSIALLKLSRLGVKPLVCNADVRQLLPSARNNGVDATFTSVHPFDAISDGDHEVLVPVGDFLEGVVQALLAGAEHGYLVSELSGEGFADGLYFGPEAVVVFLEGCIRLGWLGCL